MDLLSIKPNVVSRDLSGYVTFIYGAPKVGKTSLAVQCDNAILAAYETGYRAIPGVIAQDITSWKETKEFIRELRKPEIKSAFKTVIIDTVDIACACCEKYICAQAGVDKINEIPWGGGFRQLRTEVEDTFRTITQLGYSLFFISHDKDKTITREDGSTYNVKVPTLTSTMTEIITGMSDIYGYAHQVTDADGNRVSMLTMRSTDGSADTGCRFRYIEPEIPFTYGAICKAINDAIDKEAEMGNANLITDQPIVREAKEGPSFAELKEKFDVMVKTLRDNMPNEEFGSTWAPRIVEITNKYLGKGKKVADCTPQQVEQLELIVTELEDAVSEGI
jgi:hypothetical protein